MIIATKDVSVGGLTVTIRKVPWKKLKKARQRAAVMAQAAGVQLYEEIGGAKAFEELQEARARVVGDVEEKGRKTAKDDREEVYALYDEETVLYAGVLGWPVPVDDDGNHVPLADSVIREEIDGWDEPVADAVFREIIDLSAPAIESVEKERGED